MPCILYVNKLEILHYANNFQKEIMKIGPAYKMLNKHWVKKITEKLKMLSNYYFLKKLKA